MAFPGIITPCIPRKILVKTTMMRNIQILSLLSVAVGVFGGQYCATIDSSTADGAYGTVAMEIASGKVQYSVSLNLNGFTAATGCDYTQGLSYHIHTYWTNTTVSSSANGFCGAGFTGGHYDPNFACSASSQNSSSACTALGRVSPTYTYSCSTTTYGEGQYSLCEVGDISGKTGLLFPASATDLTFSSAQPVTDYQPPYDYNYKAQDADSLMWSSVVFHCVANANARLVCADFSTTTGGLLNCAVPFTEFSDDETGDDDKGYDENDLVIAVVVTVIVSLILGLIMGYALNRMIKNQLADNAMAGQEATHNGRA